MLAAPLLAICLRSSCNGSRLCHRQLVAAWLVAWTPLDCSSPFPTRKRIWLTRCATSRLAYRGPFRASSSFHNYTRDGDTLSCHASNHAIVQIKPDQPACKTTLVFLPFLFPTRLGGNVVQSTPYRCCSRQRICVPHIATSTFGRVANLFPPHCPAWLAKPTSDCCFPSARYDCLNRPLRLAQLTLHHACYFLNHQAILTDSPMSMLRSMDESTILTFAFLSSSLSLLATHHTSLHPLTVST